MTDTEARTPPTKSSDEAKPHQHRMAQAQGDAQVTALHHMANTAADAGGEKAVEDVIVAYAIEAAEGMYKMRGGDLVWTEPKGSNAHVEISVRGGADNRFVPGLAVTVRIKSSESGEVAFGGTLPMLWHPWLDHYGANVTVPGSGLYEIEVRSIRRSLTGTMRRKASDTRIRSSASSRRSTSWPDDRLISGRG